MKESLKWSAYSTVFKRFNDSIASPVDFFDAWEACDAFLESVHSANPALGPFIHDGSVTNTRILSATETASKDARQKIRDLCLSRGVITMSHVQSNVASVSKLSVFPQVFRYESASDETLVLSERRRLFRELRKAYRPCLILLRNFDFDEFLSGLVEQRVDNWTITEACVGNRSAFRVTDPESNMDSFHTKEEDVEGAEMRPSSHELLQIRHEFFRGQFSFLVELPVHVALRRSDGAVERIRVPISIIDWSVHDSQWPHWNVLRNKAFQCMCTIPKSRIRFRSLSLLGLSIMKAVTGKVKKAAVLYALNAKDDPASLHELCRALKKETSSGPSMHAVWRTFRDHVRAHWTNRDVQEFCSILEEMSALLSASRIMAAFPSSITYIGTLTLEEMID